MAAFWAGDGEFYVTLGAGFAMDTVDGGQQGVVSFQVFLGAHVHWRRDSPGETLRDSPWETLRDSPWETLRDRFCCIRTEILCSTPAPEPKNSADKIQNISQGSPCL